MSWGIKIALLYSGFVLMIVGMVTLSMRQKVDLVSKDYYAQELAFQDKIDKQVETRKLASPLRWESSGDSLRLVFPEELAGNTTHGQIVFFRPSDATMDVKVNIEADTARYRKFHTGKLKSGLYHLQISWEANGRKYYNEGRLNVQ